MEVMVMAAGEGRRLRPLTERWAKPVLPIDGRAVIATLLRQLADEELGPVTVVTGHLADQVERLIDGLGASFVRQPEPLGSADAVNRALDAGVGLPAIVCGADTVFQAGDLGRFCETFAAAPVAGAIAYRRDPPPGPGRAALEVEDELVRRVVDDDPANPRSAAPLWGLTEAISLGDLPGPPYELSVAFQRAVDAGTRVAAVEIGPTRDLTEPADLVRENFPYLEGV